MNKTFKVKSERQLDVIEQEWSRRGLRPLTMTGELPVNGAHAITRVSPNELKVITTESHELTFRVVVR